MNLRVDLKPSTLAAIIADLSEYPNDWSPWERDAMLSCIASIVALVGQQDARDLLNFAEADMEVVEPLLDKVTP
jgi:hypothetical protein